MRSSHQRRERRPLDDTAHDIAQEYHDLAFSTSSLQKGTTSPILTGPHNVQRAFWGSGSTVSDLQSVADVASTYGSVLTLGFHDVGSSGDLSTTDFETVVDYVVNQKGMQVITPSQFASLQQAF